MAFDARDEIWNAAYDTYYSSYFEEMVCDVLLDRWQWLDEFTKILVALTATGSALAGWALWQDPNFKWIWTLLAGTGAVLAILHAALDVSGRLKSHGDNRRLLASLRIDLETFRYRMQANNEFSVDEFTNELVELRERYGQAIDRGRNDIMLTDSMRKTVQDELDERIANKIDHPEGG
jgi:hypothetical protein